MLPSLLLRSSLTLLAITFLFSPASSTSRHALSQPQIKNGFKIPLTRVDSAGDFSKLELLQRAIKRGHHRLERLSAMALSAASGDNDLKAPVHAGNGEFLMNLYIGTPATPFTAIMDTGSDLIWTQCKPCTTCYSQETPIFDPKQSSSFSILPCSNNLCKALPAQKCSNGCQYLYAYGDYSMTQGIMALETFSFGNSPNQVSVSNVGFGCGQDNEGNGFEQAAGLVGLGRGPLSLVTQLGLKKFSYCLTSIDDNTTSSSLLFGSLADSKQTKGLISTPLIQNPSMATYYYLSLEGITVGGTRLPISKSSFELQEDGSGGLIIDSGTTITYLEEKSFDKLTKSFVSQMKLPVATDDTTGLDLCFSLPSDGSPVEVPKLIFHFSGEADLDLPAENYMIGDENLGLLCLAMGKSSGMSVFGNVQQQNMLILHDFEKESMSFLPTKCDQL